MLLSVNDFYFETNFLKNEFFFKKLEYQFLVESTKIENTSFPYKTALSETNFKTNRIGKTEWTYHKKQSFNVTFFSGVFVSVEEPLIKR